MCLLIHKKENSHKSRIYFKALSKHIPATDLLFIPACLAGDSKSCSKHKAATKNLPSRIKTPVSRRITDQDRTKSDHLRVEAVSRDLAEDN